MQRKYELLYVLNGTLTDEALNSQMERVNAIVEASAEIEDVFVWGRRKMAYEIQDIREGFYVIVHFQAEPDAPKELERLLRISDVVMRYLIVVAEGNFMPPVKRVGEADDATETEIAPEADDVFTADEADFADVEFDTAAEETVVLTGAEGDLPVVESEEKSEQVTAERTAE